MAMHEAHGPSLKKLFRGLEIWPRGLRGRLSGLALALGASEVSLAAWPWGPPGQARRTNNGPTPRPPGRRRSGGGRRSSDNPGRLPLRVL